MWSSLACAKCGPCSPLGYPTWVAPTPVTTEAPVGGTLPPPSGGGTFPGFPGGILPGIPPFANPAPTTTEAATTTTEAATTTTEAPVTCTDMVGNPLCYPVPPAGCYPYAYGGGGACDPSCCN